MAPPQSASADQAQSDRWVTRPLTGVRQLESVTSFPITPLESMPEVVMPLVLA
jgi:hypothetical protein